MIGRVTFRGDFFVQAGKIQCFNNIIDKQTQIIRLNKTLNTRWEKRHLVLIVWPDIAGFGYLGPRHP